MPVFPNNKDKTLAERLKWSWWLFVPIVLVLLAITTYCLYYWICSASDETTRRLETIRKNDARRRMSLRRESLKKDQQQKQQD